MSSLGSPNPFFIAGKKAYEVERSLRFNDADSAYLIRTPSSAGDRRTWTWSGWVKRANADTNMNLFSVRESASVRTIIRITDKLDFLDDDINFRLKTNQVIRDPSAWYHFVIVSNTTDSTSSNRLKVYVNGERYTNFATSTYPSQNYEGQINNTYAHALGREGAQDNDYLDGYMAEVNFVDGQAYDPSYFGKTDPVTGQWNPKKYVGSYGTNGFYLNFSDNSGTTATTLGKDYSGNGNNFTPNNFSVSAGAGNDSLEDSPTNNFCTLNPLDKMGTVTVSEGNLKVVINGDNASLITGSFGVSSGKWYYEAVADTAGAGFVGWIRPDVSSYTGYPYQQSGSLIYFINGALYKDGAGGQSYGASYTDGDIIGCAINLDDNQVTFYKNNSSQGTVSITAGTYSPNTTTGGSSATFTFNFGQRAFSYTPPTGFKALNSANLPDPTIKLPDKHFNTLLYTGNGGTQSITGLEFQPDWVWLKKRNGTTNHLLFDIVRGTNKSLNSNSSGAEDTSSTNKLTSFNSDGFTLGSNGSGNNNSDTFVAWNWNAGDTDGKTYTVTVVSDSGNKYRFDGYGTSAVTLDLAEGGTYIFNYPSAHPFRFSTTSDGTHGGGSEYTTGVVVNSSTQVQITVAASAPTLYYYCTQHSGMGGQVNTNSTLGSSNFDGSTQSTVKVNATAGFSIVKYAGNGSTATIGHGLGVAPQTYIVKQLNSAADWYVYHKQIGATYQLKLNDTIARADNDRWQDTDPTSSVFYLAQKTASNGSGDTYIAYCFSEVAGYSKFGRYDGNNANNGTFVYTGFRPAWVMIKRYETTRDWIIYDNKRSTFNVIDDFLEPNNSTAEQTSSTRNVDFLANGFKFRGSDGDMNGAGDYIYFAFAESTFKYARAR